MIVLMYLLCGVLFMVVRAVAAAILKHYVRGFTEADYGIAAYLIDLALWPVSFLLWLIGWFMITRAAVSAYLTARRLGL